MTEADRDKKELYTYLKTIDPSLAEAFEKNPEDEDVEMFFMGCIGCESGVDAHDSHCCGSEGKLHPAHYNVEEKIVDEYERMKEKYEKYIQEGIKQKRLLAKTVQKSGGRKKSGRKKTRRKKRKKNKKRSRKYKKRTRKYR